MIPGEVVDVLVGAPTPGVPEQALPLLTVDEVGFPEVCLLSRAEVDADEQEVRMVVASTRARRNLLRDGRACLIVIEGTTAHYFKLRVTRTLETEGRLAAVLQPVDHRPDSLGIPLAPVRFTPTDALAELERWDVSARALAALRA